MIIHADTDTVHQQDMSTMNRRHRGDIMTDTIFQLRHNFLSLLIIGCVIMCVCCNRPLSFFILHVSLDKGKSVVVCYLSGSMRIYLALVDHWKWMCPLACNINVYFCNPTNSKHRLHNENLCNPKWVVHKAMFSVVKDITICNFKPLCSDVETNIIGKLLGIYLSQKYLHSNSLFLTNCKNEL